MADSYSPNGDMFEGYVNITKPYEIDAAGEKWSRIPVDNETVELLKEYGSSVFKEEGKWRTTPADLASTIEEAIENNDLDCDGIIIKNIDDTGSYYKDKETHLATDYIVFKSNQFKNEDNKTPTESPDIRYSKKVDISNKSLTSGKGKGYNNNRIKLSEREYAMVFSAVMAYNTRFGKENELKPIIGVNANNTIGNNKGFSDNNAEFILK